MLGERVGVVGLVSAARASCPARFTLISTPAAKLEVLFVGVFFIRALLFAVYRRGPCFLETPT